MTRDEAIATLRGIDFSTLRETLAESCASDPAQIDLTVGWIGEIRDRMVAEIGEIELEEDIDAAVAVAYIELKSRWIALNTAMNYRMVKGVMPDPADQQRAFAASMILMAIEAVLSPEDIEQITEFLAQPVRPAA